MGLQWLSLQSQCLLQLLKLQHLQRARSEQVTILPFTTTSLKSPLFWTGNKVILNVLIVECLTQVSRLNGPFRWNTRPACVAVSPDDLTLFFSTEIEISLKKKVFPKKKKKKKKKKS